ncbi:unnamed protein product, partial [Brenthis ino]
MAAIFGAQEVKVTIAFDGHLRHKGRLLKLPVLFSGRSFTINRKGNNTMFVCVWGYPQIYEIQKFKVGIEYENSLPMTGGSDRYRHKNNYDPFFVTVTANVKTGYVLSYLDVTSTVGEGGEVSFSVIRGTTGHKSIVFQLISNHSDFLSYSYLAYGIREEEYKKINNIISLP